MSVGAGYGRRHEPESSGEPGFHRRRLSTSKKAIQAEMVGTPTPELDDKLATYAAGNPALVRFSDDVLDETAAAEGVNHVEEDETPDILGEEGDSYELDPDGDFSNAGDYRSASKSLPSADLIIHEEVGGEAAPLSVELGSPAPLWRVRSGAGVTRAEVNRATWLLECVARRQQWLLELGELVIELQHPFFEASSPEEAVRALKRLTREEAAGRLGIDATVLGRLIARKVVETPRFGRIPLSAFFFAGDEVSTAVLAGEIRCLLTDAGGRMVAPEIRLELERRGIISPSKTARQKAAWERQIRRARETLGSGRARK